MNISKEAQETIYTLSIIIMCLILCFGCKTKESITETKVEKEYVVDSSYVEKYDSLKEVYTLEKSKLQKQIKTIEREKESLIEGMSGEDTDSTSKEKNILITNGGDTVSLYGDWNYIRYKWYKAARENIYSYKVDSLSNVSNTLVRSNKSKDSIIKVQRDKIDSFKSDKSKIVRVANWDYIFIALGVGLILGFVIYFYLSKVIPFL